MSSETDKVAWQLAVHMFKILLGPDGWRSDFCFIFSPRKNQNFQNHTKIVPDHHHHDQSLVYLLK